MTGLESVAWPPAPIRTERLVLRGPEARDRAAVIELFASPEVGSYLGGPRPRDELERTVPEAPRRRPGQFVVDLDGAMIGMVTFDRRDPQRPGHVRPEAGEAELGYLFLPGAWGYGYATEACTAALDWFAGVLPDEPVVLRTQTANGRAMRLAAKLGFTEVERFEEYGAEQWFGVWAGGEPIVHLAPPASEVPISRELVRTLLAEQFPDLADRHIAEPSEGFNMAVFRLGEDLAVRLPRHRESVQPLESEIRWVGLLADGWTFPTQRIVHVGRPGAEVPWRWAVTSWLPGELAGDRPLEATAAPALGRALAEIHQAAPADAPFNSEQSIPLVAREPVLRQVLPELPAVGASRGLVVDLDAATALWRQAIAVPDDAPRVWIHADLHPFNVISLGGRFAGIIDWSDICGGDPAVDLGFLQLLLPAPAMATAFESYGGVDPATALRSRAIALVKAATLAHVRREAVAAVGWRALVELGIAKPARQRDQSPGDG